MLRVRIFAFAVACIMVAPQADAQGNRDNRDDRGNSNGVPGSIANIQSIVDAVRAQFAALVASLPAVTTLKADVAGLKTAVANLTARLNALDARVGVVDSRLTAEVATLNAKIDAATAQLDASIDTVEAQLQGQISGMDARLDAVEASLGTALGDVSDLKTRVLALEGAGGGGGAASAINWSGGCTIAGAAGAQRYCTDGIDFNTAAGYVSVATNGVITFDRAGMYRVTLSAVSQGVTGSASATINGAGVSQTFSSVGTVLSNKDVTLSFVHPFSEDYFMEIYLTNSPVSYLPWAAAGGWSRLQIEYVGPLPATPEI